MKKELKKYYFTYGSDEKLYPYYGGWSVVNAPDFAAAVKAHMAAHPTEQSELIKCSMIYDEQDFINTGMDKKGNLGAFCHETITLSVEVHDEQT